jgi:hypothetical protein
MAERVWAEGPQCIAMPYGTRLGLETDPSKSQRGDSLLIGLVHMAPLPLPAAPLPAAPLPLPAAAKALSSSAVDRLQ